MDVDWERHHAREAARYEDGARRLPDEGDARQKQLVRIAMAAGGAGLARLMQGQRDEAREWLLLSAERYRESFEGAPPESWGRPVGAVKARILAGDWEGAASDAKWAVATAGASQSPIARYAATLALLVLGRDTEAANTARALLEEPEDVFPGPVAESLFALAVGDGAAYGDAVDRVLSSFEARDAYLEDIPVADTVLVLEALAERGGIAARLHSPLLPDG